MNIGNEEMLEFAEQRQIVMFEMAGETYGINLDIVQEVIYKTGITMVPQTPDFMEGVINLRGYVIPVVDLKKRFNLGAVENTKSARIIVVEVEDQIIGVAVDKVSEVITISEDSIEPPSPLLRGAIKADYLAGFAEVSEELVKILNFSKIFSLQEIAGLREIENLAGDISDAE
ncbi:MAG: chemotaxis protein CheW [bacterium]